METQTHLQQQQEKNNNQDHHHHNNKESSTTTTISPVSSPSHEFSFTISLNTSSSSSSSTTTTSSSSSSSSSKLHRTLFEHNTNKLSKTKPNTEKSPLSIVDLSPADDIFFHGHLLPLTLLSHLPSVSLSPRSSTNSLDSFTLPIKDLSSSEPSQQTNPPTITTTTTTNTNTNTNKKNPKPFSLFNLRTWKKPTNPREIIIDENDHHHQQQQKRKMRFDMRQVIKRYVRMVFRGGRRSERRNGIHFQRQPYSFSGILSPRNSSNGFIGGKRAGQYSAPASIRTSPTNSGLLVATSSATSTIPSSASDSTMEELQAAIQAAIAHCKNSIATAERDKKIHNF